MLRDESFQLRTDPDKFTSRELVRRGRENLRALTPDSFVITALFTNMRILKFKNQLTIAFFATVNHLNGPLRKQNFTLTGSKGHGL